YEDIDALSHISLAVKKGELFGLIGPDGAGKTTLFRILTSLLLPDSGSGLVENLDIIKDFKKIRKIIGYMPGRFSLYQDLTVEENLNFYATIFGTNIEENYDLIRDIYVQIEPFKKRQAGKLSGGMKQKLALSCALIHKPEVLFLDEPTTGVDAVSRKEFWDMLKNLQKKGITILVSTPYMDEAGLCDRVALIQKGKILEIDKPENITKRYPLPLLEVKSSQMYQLASDLLDYAFAQSAFRFGDSIHLSLNNEEITIDEIKIYLKHKGHDQIKVRKIKAGIEDCFMWLMNH
ncbi:MAG: ABC transporter ATP-binding protein, partial [Bacteroidetes bacterium]